MFSSKNKPNSKCTMHNDLTKALVLMKTMNYNASTIINDITRILYIYIIYISSNVTRLVITFFVVHLNLALWIWGLKVYNTPLISPFYFRDLFHSSVNGVNGQWNIFNQTGNFGAILWYTFLVRLCIVDFSLIIIHQCLIIDARLGK